MWNSLLLLLALPFPTFAADVEGAKDHPMITRYPGSEIRFHERREYDRARLLLAKKSRYGDKFEERVVEGKLTRLSYGVQGTRTPLEVYRNYREAVVKKGFKILWEASGHAAIWTKDSLQHPHSACEPTGMSTEREYLAAELPGRAWVMLVTTYCRGPREIKGRPREVRALLNIVEAKQMESGLIQVNADALAEQIAQTGHASVYGILFDFNSAKIKPESKPVLDEVARLLKNKPALRLHVVGHSDNQGALDYNLTLSRDRAQAVVSWLASAHAIQPARLKGHGVGPLSPAATNQDEPGRTKNRRVELVEM